MTSKSFNKIILAYVPVLHQGYLRFFGKHADAQMIGILSRDILNEFPELKKDIRALEPEQIQLTLSALNLGPEAKVISREDLTTLAEQSNASQLMIIMPDEEMMHQLTEKYFSKNKIQFDTIFLRWDRQKSLEEQKIESDYSITQEKFQQQMMAQAKALADKSADWWRQVGAVLVQDGKVIDEVSNQHVPSSQQPYIDGDPRGNFHRGDHIELSTALHAEAALIVASAKYGRSLENAELYVTTFPCPNCAKLVAYSGIKKIYFAEGYAMVDGQTILQANGVEIIQVK